MNSTFLPNRLRQNSWRGKELNKICPPNRRDDLCLCFCLHPSMMTSLFSTVPIMFSYESFEILNANPGSWVENSILRSFFSFKKIDRERIANVDLWKRSTLSESIPSIFEKDWPWANRSCRSLKKSKEIKNVLFVCFLTIESICRSLYHTKWAIRSKKPMIEFPTLLFRD